MKIDKLLKALVAASLGVGLMMGARASATEPAKARVINLSVTKEGFEPSPVKVKKGEPLKLVVTRKTDETCAKELVIDPFKIDVELPLNKPVEVTFTPNKTGDLHYGCGMGKMVSGVLTVE